MSFCYARSLVKKTRLAPSPRAALERTLALSVALVLGTPAARAQGEPEPEPEETKEEDAPVEPPSSSPSPAEVLLPEILVQKEAIYPEEHILDAIEVHVVLIVEVDVDGNVQQARVLTSGSRDFDDAALRAIREWKFTPARREGRPVRSQIRVPFHFIPPEVSGAGAREAHGHAHKPQLPEPPLPPETSLAPVEVTVEGTREPRPSVRSTGDFELSSEVLLGSPRSEGTDLLRSVPGLYVGRGEGATVAHNYMLRGFDADHGQDIEFRIGDLPINMPSHIHGQGYADMGLLIADTVGSVGVREGAYDPEQGDFAVAGTIDVRLRVPEAERGITLRSGFGSFDSFRQLALFAPRGLSEETFGAVEYRSTSGFGENRKGQNARLNLQHRFGSGDLTFRAIALMNVSQASSAGVVRRDDVESGDVCFLCVYDEATARAQGGQSTRFLSGLFADYQGDQGANGQAGVWLSYDHFRLQGNFTGFIERSELLDRTSGRGDLIEQMNETLSFGLKGRYRTAPTKLSSWAQSSIELGLSGRMDGIEQAQNLIDASSNNQTWDKRVDASIRAADAGFFGDVSFDFTRLFKARVGVRSDLLAYAVDDRLSNLAERSRPTDASIPGYRRSAAGLAAGPRASLEFRPSETVQILAAYGEGYRSPAGRSLDDGQQAPFTKVRSMDLGVRYKAGAALEAALGGFHTALSNDLAFDASEGRLEAIGPTARTGATAYLLARPVDWSTVAISSTLVDARLTAPPPPSAEEPISPFSAGSPVPFVPPLVVRVDASLKKEILHRLGDKPLIGKAGLGISFLAERPLPYGGAAAPFSLLDASLGLLWGPFDLSVDGFNLFDSRYAAVEYSYASDWSPNDGVRSRLPARHTAAGSPLQVMVNLGIRL